jgi:hypothetical protein
MSRDWAATLVVAAGVGLVAQPVAQRGRVGLVAQQGVRDDEAGVGGPGVDGVAALARQAAT